MVPGLLSFESLEVPVLAGLLARRGITQFLRNVRGSCPLRAPCNQAPTTKEIWSLCTHISVYSSGSKPVGHLEFSCVIMPRRSTLKSEAINFLLCPIVGLADRHITAKSFLISYRRE